MLLLAALVLAVASSFAVLGQGLQRGGTPSTDKVRPVNGAPEPSPYRIVRNWAELTIEQRPWAAPTFRTYRPPATIDAHYLWQADNGEIIIVRNGGSFGSLVPSFETRVDGPFAYLNAGRYLSSNPGVGQGGVALTFYESVE